MRTTYILLALLTILLSFLLTKGSAQARWQITPSLTLSEAFDTNIYLTDTKTEDYITRAAANLSVTYDGPDVVLVANYVATLNIFEKNPELNVVTQDGSFDIDLNRFFNRFLREVNVTLTEDFMYNPELSDYYFDERRGDVGVLSSYGIMTGRNDSYRNAFSIYLQLPLSRRQNINTRYSNLFTEYSDPSFADNITHSVSVGTRYSFTRDVVYGDIGISDTGADSVESNVSSVTAGFQHSFSRNVLFDINGGVNIQDYEEGGSTSSWRGGLRFSSRYSFITYNAGYTRGLNPVSGISTIPTGLQLFYLNIRVTHSRNITTNLGANYTANKSIRGDEVDTRSYNLSARLSYLINQWLQANFSLSHFNQESETQAARDIQRNLIMLQFSATM